MPEKGKRPPYNVTALESNVSLVFRAGDIGKLNKPTYDFIILYMGFIAHYGLSGFQDAYSDLERFALSLQTSEYSRDPDYNLNLAERYERDEYFTREYGGAYYRSVAEGIRRIVAVARNRTSALALG